MSGALSVERRGHVVILENQDAPRNRMTFEYMDELEAAVLDLRDDPEVRAVVITAAGDEHFSVDGTMIDMPALGATNWPPPRSPISRCSLVLTARITAVEAATPALM